MPQPISRGMAIGSALARRRRSPQASGPAFAADPMPALVTAAKAEGSVVVNGPPIDVVREALVTGFQNAYGIPVSYISGSSQSGSRVGAERAAGKFLLDVLVAGVDTPDADVSSQRMARSGRAGARRARRDRQAEVERQPPLVRG